uniref:Ig-like domain-containing protein n=1 Tax=Macrostomum lignano TaxID=282301 RepID=A0A1I8FGQ1_9PLAT
MAARLEVDLKVAHRPAPAPSRPSRSRHASPATSAKDLEAQVNDKVTIACIVHGHPSRRSPGTQDGVLLAAEQPRIEGFEHRLGDPVRGPRARWRVLHRCGQTRSAKPRCHCVISVDRASLRTAESRCSPPRLHAWTLRRLAAAAQRLPWCGPELLSLFRDRYCRAGEPVTLECEVAASPARRSRGASTGQPIDSSDRRFTVSSRGRLHRLRLARATPRVGRICLARENDAGFGTCGALLIVEDPTVVDCSQKVIRASTKLFNRRPRSRHVTGRQLRGHTERLPPDGAATGLSCICGFGFACSEGFFCSDDLEPPSPLNSRSSKPW